MGLPDGHSTEVRFVPNPARRRRWLQVVFPVMGVDAGLVLLVAGSVVVHSGWPGDLRLTCVLGGVEAVSTLCALWLILSRVPVVLGRDGDALVYPAHRLAA